MKDEIKLKDMTGFLENVYKDIKKQPTLEEELEKERKFINKIKGVEKIYSLYHPLEREQWEVWVTIKSIYKEQGRMSTRCIFEGTKSECEKKIRELKKDK